MVGSCAVDRDKDGRFPELAFQNLRDIGLLARPPIESQDAAALFGILAAVGRGDLSVGRIFEGHVNALFLLEHYGTLPQRKHYQGLTSGGHIFGVWNTDMPGEPVTLDGMRLTGKKNFASGADGISYAVITAGTAERQRLMILIPIAGLPVDRSWWRPLGMRASGSHVVDFTGINVEPDWILGGDDDYVREPWFSGGAIQFAAVHVGGMHAVFDAAVDHLRATRRIGDAHQLHRVGRMGIAVESGYAWLERAAMFWTVADQPGAGIVAIANAARLAIESLALGVLELAERSVGAAGLIAPHPLERLVRDLRTYLRQPNPDGALTSLGAAIANDRWRPGRSFEGDGKI